MIPTHALVQTPSGGWFGYPNGARLIIGFEFWERFRFYGILSIPALFLTGNRAIAQRFGWHFGFAAADMSVALGSYLFFAPRSWGPWC